MTERPGSTHLQGVGSCIVLGAACGYSTEQLRPFVHSARAAIPSALITLFVDPDKMPRCEDVYFVRCSDCRIRNQLRRLSRGRRLASRLILGCGRLCGQLGGLGKNLLQSAFGVAIARYFWYRDWLSAHPGPPQQHVLLADTRDVVMQQDPFEGLAADRMFCGVEPVFLGDCGTNSMWYRSAYGEKALGDISDREVLCSGVTGGPRWLIQKYLNEMCGEILRVGSRILWAAGYDQALHNHLLRNTALGASCVFEPWDSDRLTTLHYASDRGFEVNCDGQLCGPSGRVVSVVHQYDRHLKLQQWADAYTARATVVAGKSI